MSSRTSTHNLSDASLAQMVASNLPNPQYPPLELVNRPTVETAAAAHYLNRRPQTLRGWHCHGTYPEGLRPKVVMGRLAWPVSGIRMALGVGQ